VIGGLPVPSTTSVAASDLAVFCKKLSGDLFLHRPRHGVPQFLADATKFNLDIDVATPDEVQRLLADFASYPKPVLDRAKAAIGR